MTRMLLLRHAESTWNAESRWQGWADPPLSPLGERQAGRAARRLTGLGLTSVFASDLRRARATAEILATALGLGPVAIEPDLRERDVGEWSGFTSAEVDERWPGVRDAWRAGKLISPPGGEANDEFAARILGALERVATASSETGAHDPVLVVTHGGVIRMLSRQTGEHPQLVGALAGRWFELEGTELRAGEPITGAEASEPGEPAESG